MAADRRQSLHGAPACGRSQRRSSGHEPHPRGLTPTRQLAVEAGGRPGRGVPTEGTRAACTPASTLIEGIAAEQLLADTGSDTDAIRAQARRGGRHPVIPPKNNRTAHRASDEDLAKRRPVIEPAFLMRQRWRGIAPRDAQHSTSCLAAVPSRCLALWLNIS